MLTAQSVSASHIWSSRCCIILQPIRKEPMMSFQNLRIAIRHLLKSPGFPATAVLMLALGIGATTAIFSIVEGVLLRPLPFPHSAQLMDLTDVMPGAAGDAGVTAP